jgi:hypothetical protein
MSWREERDALIAQTLAFVQSVTGKPADFAQLGPPAEPSVEQPPLGMGLPAARTEHSADDIDAAGFEVMRAEAAMVEAAMRLVSNNPRPAPAATGAGAARAATAPSPASLAPLTSPTASAQPTISAQPDGQPAQFTGEHFTSISSELGLQRDMQSEIKARVATFRAHQERFSRERQEYFSSTLAKLRASMTAPDSDQ